MTKEIRNAWWDYFSILSSQAVAVPISLVYIAFVTRLLGPAKWGILTLFMSVTQFLFRLGISWSSSSLIRFGKEEFLKEGHLRKTFAARLLFLLISVVILFIPLFFLRDTIVNYIGFSRRIFWFLFLMLVVNAVADHFTWTLKAIGFMRQFALCTVLRQLALLFFVILFLLLFNSFSVQTVINFEILSYVAVAIFCIFFFKVNYFFPLEIDVAQIKRILIYSWPLIFTFLFGYASNWMDVYFIRYYLSSYYVGVYQVAYRMMLYLVVPLMSVITLTFPLLMAIKNKGQNDLISVYIKNLTPQFSLFWSIIVSIIMVMGSFVIRTIFGNSFVEAALPFMILLLGVSFQILAIMYTSIYAIFDWLRYTTLIAFIMCVVNVVGNIFLIPRIGILGAAIATAISYGLSSILYLIVANKLMSLKTYKALLYPIFPILSFVFCLIIKEFSLRIFFVGCIIATSLILGKYSRIFREKDIALFERVEMPFSLRKVIKRIYLTLS